jgi:hypothetical protein
MWAVAVLPPILLTGTALDVLAMFWMFVVSIPAFTAAPAVALIFFVLNLFRRRWRAAASIVLACATFALVAVVSGRFHDELKWYVWRDHYMAQIDRLPVAPGKVRSVHWDGGMGWEITLEYYETEPDARAWFAPPQTFAQKDGSALFPEQHLLLGQRGKSSRFKRIRWLS